MRSPSLSLFSWPGMGQLMVESAASHDYPVAQGTFLMLAILVIGLNFFTDVLYLSMPKQEELFKFLDRIIDKDIKETDEIFKDWSLFKYYLMFFPRFPSLAPLAGNDKEEEKLLMSKQKFTKQ